jgi:hypothetical protein
MTRSAGASDRTVGDREGHATQGASTETKAAFKTTEFIAYLVILLAIMITSYVVGGDPNSQDLAARVDPFGAKDAMFYITILTIGYMICRGLAKAGSREPYSLDR